MVIKYINTKEDYCEILEYVNGKRLKLFNIIAGFLSGVIGVCIYILLYKFDNMYRITISVLISILICIIAIKRNRNSFYRIVDKLETREILELTIDKNLISMKTKEKEAQLKINKNKEYNLLNINNKWILMEDKNWW